MKLFKSCFKSKPKSSSGTQAIAKTPTRKLPVQESSISTPHCLVVGDNKDDCAAKITRVDLKNSPYKGAIIAGYRSFKEYCPDKDFDVGKYYNYLCHEIKKQLKYLGLENSPHKQAIIAEYLKFKQEFPDEDFDFRACKEKILHENRLETIAEDSKHSQNFESSCFSVSVAASDVHHSNAPSIEIPSSSSTQSAPPQEHEFKTRFEDLGALKIPVDGEGIPQIHDSFAPLQEHNGLRILPVTPRAAAYPALKKLQKQGFAVQKIVGQGVFGLTILLEKQGVKYIAKVNKQTTTDQKKTGIELETETLSHLHTHSTGAPQHTVRLVENDVAGVMMLEFLPLGIGDDFYQTQTGCNFHSKQVRHTNEVLAHDLIASLLETLDRGVIHRDIKSDNIRFTDDGVMKLIDFGLAEISDVHGVVDKTSGNGDITSKNHLIYHALLRAGIDINHFNTIINFYENELEEARGKLYQLDVINCSKEDESYKRQHGIIQQNIQSIKNFLQDTIKQLVVTPKKREDAVFVLQKYQQVKAQSKKNSAEQVKTWLNHLGQELPRITYTQKNMRQLYVNHFQDFEKLYQGAGISFANDDEKQEKFIEYIERRIETREQIRGNIEHYLNQTLTYLLDVAYLDCLKMECNPIYTHLMQHFTADEKQNPHKISLERIKQIMQSFDHEKPLDEFEKNIKRMLMIT